jgi:hypothetical protein
MEALKLKFAVQSPDDTLSGATDTTIEQITPQWVRFSAPAGVLVQAGLDPEATLSMENRIVMFIYLDPTQPPIRAIGRISWYEKAPMETQDSYSVVVEFQEITEEDRKKIQKHINQKQLRDTKEHERRIRTRRQSDLFVQEMARMLEVLANMSEGRKEEFGEQFANLVGMKNALGRRLEDKKLGDEICFHVERLASNLANMVGRRAGLRRVQIRKVLGKMDAAVEKDRIFVGWEESPPQVGKSYILYLEGGGIFRSAVVTQVLKDHFRTRNSLYEIQPMEP